MPGKSGSTVPSTLLRPFAIPAITPLAFAIFRGLFGLGLFYVFWRYEPFTVLPPIHDPHSPFANVDWLYQLAQNHRAMRLSEYVACGAAAMFALGVWARPMYFVVVTMAFLDVLKVLGRVSAHDWGLPLVTLLALTVVRWSDVPNLAVIASEPRKYASPQQRSCAMGFAVWLPGLTIGLAFAAAAYAKVFVTGVRWITNGTVRYHFVEDGRNAPVAWGLWIATHSRLAVALSLAAVVVEAIFILVIFVREWRTRLAFGLMGLSLMVGFTLFQGIAWWPWRILFLAFLPWTLLTMREEPEIESAPAAIKAPRALDLGWTHATVVALLVGVQLWASAREVEVQPFVSNYPMYAYTWSSTDEFERGQVRMHFEAGGIDITDRVNSIDGHGVLRDIVEAEKGHGRDLQKQLGRFAAGYQERYGEAPPAIDVVLIHRPFDWQNGKYLPEFREYVDTIRFNSNAQVRSSPPSAAAAAR